MFYCFSVFFFACRHLHTTGCLSVARLERLQNRFHNISRWPRASRRVSFIYHCYGMSKGSYRRVIWRRGVPPLSRYRTSLQMFI
ncbi:hypothetical protein K474DRAFT_695097 [Panus rudis PR-1116 ss-1]|nr:hypothetical protein K474DRAFT_695097 [Panus rudis PR-1116 ss-1]